MCSIQIQLIDIWIFEWWKKAWVLLFGHKQWPILFAIPWIEFKQIYLLFFLQEIDKFWEVAQGWQTICTWIEWNWIKNVQLFSFWPLSSIQFSVSF